MISSACLLLDVLDGSYAVVEAFLPNAGAGGHVKAASLKFESFFTGINGCNQSIDWPVQCITSLKFDPH